jgi:hypothetical protein
MSSLQAVSAHIQQDFGVETCKQFTTFVQEEEMELDAIIEDFGDFDDSIILDMFDDWTAKQKMTFWNNMRLFFG